MRGRGYLSNYGIAFETSVVYAKSQFPSFLVDEQDGVMIVLRCTGLYLAFLKVLWQVLLILISTIFHLLFAALWLFIGFAGS